MWRQYVVKSNMCRQSQARARDDIMSCHRLTCEKESSRDKASRTCMVKACRKSRDSTSEEVKKDSGVIVGLS